MARKSKTRGETTTTETEQARPAEVLKVPSTAVLKRLMASARAMVKDLAEMRGTFAAEVKTAVQDHNLHKGAFGWVRTLDKKEPEALKEWMDHFEHYYETSGLRRRADSVVRMDLGDEEGAAEEGNVRPFPTQPAA
jgi:hypothetical protein